MTIQNCLNVLKELCAVEEQISSIEKKALKEELDIDYQRLLHALIQDITDH